MAPTFKSNLNFLKLIEYKRKASDLFRLCEKYPKTSEMFNLFYRTLMTRKSNLFQDNFEVVELELTSLNERKLLQKENFVELHLNQTKISNEDVLYYEIVYHREKLFAFLVYHNTSQDVAENHFAQFKIVLNNLSKSITNIKATAETSLKSIMSSLKINTNWTSTHIAAKVGFETHFKEAREIAYNEINHQVDDDRFTPLHLAINNQLAPIVRLILDLAPDLDLVDSKQFSVLHCAALSTFEIFCMVIHQPNMFERISWKNYQGCTALHLACFAQNYNTVFEFLKFGLTVRMLTLPPPKARQTTIKVKRMRRKAYNPQGPYDQIVKFTEQDLVDIDYQDIAMAGSPLHWVLHKRLMDKLIAHKFKLNIPNLNGDTPLIVMTKRNRLRCVISLLCSGANVNCKNKFGNTPLHHAIKIDEITLPQTLIVFDADINAVNNINESVRHLAAKESSFSQQVILYLMASLGANRCPKDRANCTPGCSYDGSFEGRCSPPLLELTNCFGSFFHNIKNSMLFEYEMDKEPDIEEMKHYSNLLALDGGGIRGLVIVQVLMEFQKHLDRPLIDYFDWIAGTSTGSFLAAFLVTGKSLPEIRNIYFLFKDKVFVGDKRPYDSEPLENLVQEIIGPDLKMEDFKKTFNKNVIIPAALYDRCPMKMHLFRSYESHHELLGIPDDEQGFSKHPSRDQLVWKACRASGAAPTYFKSFGPFIDGGMMANNPTLDALTEFEFYNNALNCVGRHNECNKLKLVLSIGTGRQKVEESKTKDISTLSFNLMELNNQINYIYQMINLLLYEVCNTDNHVVNRAEAFCSAGDILYFRINPMFTKLIELDETLDFKLINILWETKRFMYLQRNEVIRICNYLKKFTYFPESDDDFNKETKKHWETEHTNSTKNSIDRSIERST